MNRTKALLPYARVLTEWHREVTQREKLRRGKMLGEGAQLRRAPSLGAVAFLPGYHALLQRLEASGLEASELDRERLALLATLLARVKRNTRPATPADAETPAAPAKAASSRKLGPTLPQRLGAKAKGSERPLMSEMRFRKLLECETPEELRLPMIRAIDLLGGELDVLELATDAFGWSQAVRKRWAYDYYDAAARTEAGPADALETKGDAA